MKNILLFLISLFPIITMGQNWQWAKQVGGSAQQSYDHGNVKTDGTNFYLYGTFSGVMQLQSGTFNSNGVSDFFIIKYDNNGNEQWVKTFGGYNSSSQGENISALYDSVSNCIYLTGTFQGSMSLGGSNLVSNGYGRNFLAKMDLTGTVLWAKKIWTRVSSNLNDYERMGWVLQKNGIIVIYSNLLDTAYFDGLVAGPGGCLAKLDGNGTCFFTRHFYDFSAPPPSYEGGFSIKYVGSDMIILGNFKNTLWIDTAVVTSNGDYDMLLARADSNGHIKWIKRFGYGNIDFFGDHGIDAYGNLYAVGGFGDSISFNGNSFYSPVIDFIFMKFDSIGNLIFANQGNSSTTIINPGQMVADNDGNTYVAGDFTGSVTFGNYSISTTNQIAAFLARFNSNGDCLGVKHFGKADASSIVVDQMGNPVVAGGIANTVTIGNNTFTTNGPWDVYLAKCDIFTGIGGNEKTPNSQLHIYANPNAGKCNITIPDDLVNEKELTLSIYDNTGKMIQQKSVALTNGKVKVNLEAQAKGVYTVTVTNGVKFYHGKIVFE
ncbi:MAG: T9SS type A sorting domain-containing protein [Bacteroidetes bacterium]|nr:T9SS type A sorting domain-containing protein [Bacteroidota bacterium]